MLFKDMPGSRRQSRVRKLRWGVTASVSSMALICAAGMAQAQTVINNGDNVTVTSNADGETITAAPGVTSQVDGAPLVIFDNDDVTLTNGGTLITTGVTQTVQVNELTTGGVINNQVTGTLQADSRVVDIRGDDTTLNNDGDIIGTGDQRNGTVYTNDTANNFTINNNAGGLIDAGAGNQGAGISVSLDTTDPVNGDINNDGEIAGRGNAGAGAATAGDGIRIETVRVGGALGANTGTFTGNITNSGEITSEGANSTVAGFRAVNGVSFQGTLTNEEGGVISGTQNGVYFGNPVPSGGGDHTGGVVNNLDTISSDSRALNIDGIGLEINNSGQIVGTGNQRNGTAYADSTAQEFTLNNQVGGVIDAGAGNLGAGFSAELSEGGNDFTIVNDGDIAGRGNAGAGAATAGDGIRLERERVGGNLDGTTTGLFTGEIVNSGTITSEGANGTVAGFRAVNGVSFQGTLINEAGGVISGTQNGVYFGNPVPAGGGDHTGGVVNNHGTISSDSRAFNIDGLGLEVNNSGLIVGTGNQRNGTLYADGTADQFTVNNLEGGVIDAGIGNQGSGISLQLGAEDGDERTISIVNDGTVAGRGDALPSGETAGVRLFNGAGPDTTVTVFGDVVNTGDITSETSAAILIENIDFDGILVNSGNLTGVTAVDASTALDGVTLFQTGGSINGDFVGSDFDDAIVFESGTSILAGSVLNGVVVDVATGASVDVDGDQVIEGTLNANGGLSFTLSDDSLLVDGDAIFGNGSTVTVAAPDDITTLPLGAPITVIDETGDFIDAGLVVNILDDDFLVDYLVSISSVEVTPVAVDLAEVSADPNVSAFGGALTGAFEAGDLDADVANALNAVTSTPEFEAASLSLLPAINEGVTREIFETQRLANRFITDRLRGDGTGVWGQILGRSADRDGDGISVSGFDSEAFGIAVGVDHQVADNVIAGLSFTYSDISVDSTGASSATADIDSYQISLYGGYEQGPWFINGLIGYTFSDVDTNRNSIVGPIGGSFDVDGVNIVANAGYEFVVGNGTRLIPSVGLEYTNLSQDSFTESGGLNLNVDRGDVEFLVLRIGGEVSHDFEADGWTISPSLRLGYAYDAIGDAQTFDVSFAGAPAPFTLATTEPSESRFEFGVGVDVANTDGLTISLEYDGVVTSDYDSHGGFIRAAYRF
ncbi:MAG: autotransporter domain-containing protein [Pseudomonadota bacterium]